MNTQPSNFPRGDIRVSDAERDQAVAELSEHFQAGRVTQEEFEDRSGRALQARTRSELSELFTDLPPLGTVLAPSSGRPAAPVAGPGSLHRAGRVPLAGVVIACVVAAIIASNAFAGPGQHQGGIGWVLPAVIVGFVFLRLRGHRP
jgi:hypothetical protein